MMFAKLYETELGQILVKLDEGDKGAEVKVYFEPEGLGVCSIDFNWESETSEMQWEKAEKAFKLMTKYSCLVAVKEVVSKLCKINTKEG